MGQEKSWTGSTGERRWTVAIRGTTVHLELAGAGERYRNQVSLQTYFTEKRPGGAFSLQEDIQHYAPSVIPELETEIRRQMELGKSPSE